MNSFSLKKLLIVGSYASQISHFPPIKMSRRAPITIPIMSPVLPLRYEVWGRANQNKIGQKSLTCSGRRNGANTTCSTLPFTLQWPLYGSNYVQ